MLNVSTSFFNLIDMANDLLGPLTDRADVAPEYSRAVLEMVGEMTVGTSDGNQEFLAGLLDLDLATLYPHPNTARTVDTGLTEVAVSALAESYDVISRMENHRPVEPSEINSALCSIEQTGVVRPRPEGAAAPAQWRRRSPFRNDDSGDIGGDDQVGPAHSLSWQRSLPDGTFETLTLYHYAAAKGASETSEPWVTCVQTMIELIQHRDASDPGGSEITSEYHYESSARHRTLAESLDAADRYTGDNEDTDPQDLAWSNVSRRTFEPGTRVVFRESESGPPEPDTVASRSDDDIAAPLSGSLDTTPVYDPNCIKCRYSRPGNPKTHIDHVADTQQEDDE